jgi:GNAT superfamily N-acetyltransferase
MLQTFFVAQLKKSLPENCSILAVDSETNEIIGCALNEDAGTADLLEYDSEAEEGPLRVVTELLEELESVVKCSPGQVMRILAVATRQGHEGKGVMTAVMARSIERARELGYKAVVVETEAFSNVDFSWFIDSLDDISMPT